MNDNILKLAILEDMVEDPNGDEGKPHLRFAEERGLKDIDPDAEFIAEENPPGDYVRFFIRFSSPRCAVAFKLAYL